MDVRDYPFIAFWHGRLKKENPCKKKKKKSLGPQQCVVLPATEEDQP